MSDDWIYDYDDKEYLYQMDDDYAIGTDGHIVRNAGDSYGFDVSDGEIHLTSGWSSSDGDDDDSSYAWNSNASNHVTAGASKSGGYYSQTSKNTHPGGMDTGKAIVWTIVSLLIAAAIAGAIGGKHAGAVGAILWPIVIVVIAIIKSGVGGSASDSNSGKSGSTYSPGIGTNDDDIYYRFCQVLVAQDGRKYYYRCPDSSIQKGDYVIVPEPDGAAGVPAEVLEARFYSRNEVPVPLETAKYVKKKIDAETYFALVEKAESKDKKEEKRTQKTGMGAAGETAPAPDASSQQTIKRLRTVLWILIGVLVCIVIAALVMMAIRSSAAQPTEEEKVEATESPVPTETPEPTQVVKNLTDTETDERIASAAAELRAVAEHVAEFNEEFGSAAPEDLSAETIRSQEQAWLEHRDDMIELAAELDAVTPSDKYSTAWAALQKAAEEAADITAILSSWDDNGDGRYTAYEVSFITDEAQFWGLYFQMCLDDLNSAYNEANATPRPTATPKPQAEPYVGQYVSEAQAEKWEWQGVWSNYNNTGKKAVGYYYRDSEHAYSIKVDYDTNRIIEVGVTDFNTPATSSKRTTTGNSDPYNASDYNNPDFFYDDWYDDFYDYDEAEDYWEDYGDW